MWSETSEQKSGNGFRHWTSCHCPKTTHKYGYHAYHLPSCALSQNWHVFWQHLKLKVQFVDHLDSWLSAKVIDNGSIRTWYDIRRWKRQNEIHQITSATSFKKAVDVLSMISFTSFSILVASANGSIELWTFCNFSFCKAAGLLASPASTIWNHARFRRRRDPKNKNM